MRIRVTGGAGYIGSHTVKQLLARGHDVTIFDSLAAGHRAAVPAERLVVADLRHWLACFSEPSSLADDGP